MNGNNILLGIYSSITPLLAKGCIYIPVKMVLQVTTKPVNATDITIYKELKHG